MLPLSIALLSGTILGLSFNSLYSLDKNLPVLPITQLVDDISKVNPVPIFDKVQGGWIYLNPSLGLVVDSLKVTGDIQMSSVTIKGDEAYLPD